MNCLSFIIILSENMNVFFTSYLWLGGGGGEGGVYWEQNDVCLQDELAKTCFYDFLFYYYYFLKFVGRLCSFWMWQNPPHPFKHSYLHKKSKNKTGFRKVILFVIKTDGLFPWLKRKRIENIKLDDKSFFFIACIWNQNLLVFLFCFGGTKNLLVSY